jgi:hypothetical protein
MPSLGIIERNSRMALSEIGGQMKNKLILGLVLLVAGFLAGFFPEYLKARRASHEVVEIRKQMDSCNAGVAISQLRDLAAMLYLEATRQNYGTAREYSNRLFERIPTVAAQTTDPTLSATLEGVLRTRDTITAELAKGDPAVLRDLQNVVLELEVGIKR